MYKSKEGKKLFKYYSQYEKAFIDALKKTKNDCTENNIYIFRVSIKKLKGVYKLLEVLDKEFDYRNKFEPIKKIFLSAGIIRDSQVNLKRLKYFRKNKRSLDAYIKTQKKSIEKNSQLFSFDLIDFNTEFLMQTNKVIKKTCKTISQKRILKKIVAFAKARIDKINNLMQAERNNDDIHNIRKYLKEVSALLVLLNLIDEKTFTYQSIFALKLFEDKFGIWHDNFVLHESLENYTKTNNSETPENIEKINILIEEIMQEELKFTNSLQEIVDGSLKLIQERITYLSSMTETLSQTSQLLA
jgi:CHAD domain-containing protein